MADGVANIRVAECNGSMWGAVSWEKTPGGRDSHNPDVSKQSRPTLGMAILIDMKKKPGADQWEGQVYNAKDGQLYSSTIKPTGPDSWRSRAACWASCAAAKPGRALRGPIPSSPANSMAKGAAKTAGALPKSAAASTTAGSAEDHGLRSTRRPKPPGKKLATAGQPADTVGDI